MEAARTQIAVVGAADCDPATAARAYDVGKGLAAAGAVVLTGGRGGVMAAASRGARDAGGTTVGILPAADPGGSPPNPDVDIALFTGLGQGRNLVLVLSARAVVAVGGSWGTLSEIALATKHGRPVILLESWRLEPPHGGPATTVKTATTPAEAVALALAAAGISAQLDPREPPHA